jgi:hypothetical protein
MALVVADMVDEIVGLMPADWQQFWGDDSKDPRKWVKALCTDMIATWPTVILSPGDGPPNLTPPYTHPHTVMSPITAIKVATSALGYGGTFFGAILDQFALHLTANILIPASDGPSPHDHTIGPLAGGSLPQNPFGNLSGTTNTLKSTIIGVLAGMGMVGVDQGGFDSLDVTFSAICGGILTYLQDNGALTPMVGAGHVHVLM